MAANPVPPGPGAGTYHRVVQLIGFLPLVVGAVVAAVGVLGLRERLPRNRFVGVRTPATLRSADTFRIANKVAGPPVAVAGLVGVGSGAFTLAGAGLVVAVIGLVGLAGIAVAGGLLGHRAAEALPETEPAPDVPAGCRGCACGGCELAAARPGSVGPDVSRVGGE